MTKEEKRKLKYPDTDVFTYTNVNPKKKFTSDCTIRALTSALNLPYEEVARELFECSLKTYEHMSDRANIDFYLKSKGFVKIKQPKYSDGSKYTGREFCRTLLESHGKRMLQLEGYDTSRIFISIGAHHVAAVVDSKIVDTWDCSCYKVGTLYVRPM